MRTATAAYLAIDRTKTLAEEPASGHNRWHPDIPPLAEVEPGDVVGLETRDALRAVDEIWDEGRSIHDLYGDTAAIFLDFVQERLGEDAVEEAWRYVDEKLWQPVLEASRDEDPARLAETYAMLLGSHGYDFSCEEDDDSFRFRLHYCPSGGRMLQEGKAKRSDRHPAAFGVTEDPRTWSFGQKGVPYYLRIPSCGSTPSRASGTWTCSRPNTASSTTGARWSVALAW